MDYQVTVEQVPSVPMAASRGRATVQNIGKAIVENLDKVYAYLKTSTIKNPGHNVVLYHNRPDQNLLRTPEGVVLEAGVQVPAPFPFNGNDQVVCSETPAGTVATTIHMGIYDDLWKAHRAVRHWCQENGRDVTGLNWELYGHHHDDPAQRRTDVFYLLK